MNYIDLSLHKHSKDENKICTLLDAISESSVVVILGAPGSGKTSILEKFQKDYSSITQKISVKRFIKLITNIDTNTRVLLLDGLDEYRSVSTDKTFVLSELGNKLNDLMSLTPELKVVISCREMDWYGESDKNALKDEINKEAVLFTVMPLSTAQQNELATIFNIEDKEAFIERFSDYGFLDNPQMFYMLSEIWQSNKEAILSKSDLYQQFIVIAREHNREHQTAGTAVEIDDIFKYVGYLAFYYVFCGVDEFNAEIIDSIVSNEKGFSRAQIEAVLKTKLFHESHFSHRTIAEYALANFLLKYKLQGALEIGKERIKSLFIKSDRVPTELRGTYAWLCSLSGDDEFIRFDPYYQAIHGDNSLFNYEQKKKIILAVRDYSRKNPYFFEFSQKMELEGFYVPELDDILISEFQTALQFKNHYVYFLVNVIVQSNCASEHIKSFAKWAIEENSIPTYYRSYFIGLFQSEPDYLINILQRIKSGDITDDKDDLKEAILKRLYLESIKPSDVSEYLMEYKSEVGGYCYYLYRTPYDEKYSLVDTIYKLSYDETREPRLLLPYNVKSFIKDFFLETLLQFEEAKSADEIFKFISHFKQYYRWYEPIKFETYHYHLKDKIAQSEEKLQRLANQLFEICIDEMIKGENEKFRIYNFNYFFNYKAPNNQSEVLLSRLNTELDSKLNETLFISGLNFLPRDATQERIFPDYLDDLIAKYGFEEVFDAWKNPKKQDWEIESEKLEIERIVEELEVKRKNEEYFASKTAEEIQVHFGDLNWISNLFYLDERKNLDKYLETETLERVKSILKRAIYKDLIDPDLLTIVSLVENSPSAHRNIDSVYYTSLSLNDDIDITLFGDEFAKYLYMNALHHDRISNVIKSMYIPKLDEHNIDFVLNLLKEYIGLLVKRYFPEIDEIINAHIQSCVQLDNLKNIAMAHDSNLSNIKDAVLESFLHIYGFELSIDELHQLNELETSDNESNIINALLIFSNDYKNSFTINMAITFHGLIKDNIRELYDRFKGFSSDLKVKIIGYMMHVFDTEESIENFNGMQSSKNLCASFLTQHSLILLSPEELDKLLIDFSNTHNIWNNRILYKISELSQSQSDREYGSYSVDELKQFILDNTILSKEDFFEDIFLNLEQLKIKIEDNRNNDKDAFYNLVYGVKTKRTEEACRDILYHRLQDKYGDYIDLTKELYEANNRVDINIRYQNDLSYEVQIECKRDDNAGLNQGIEDQLINKYFSSGVQYGIYLIFYFGTKRDQELMLKKIYDSTPAEYENRIKIICIDLTFDEVQGK
jgi:hypothetical protein